MKKILVVYFSASGTTAQVAKRLAAATQADLYEIAPQIPYTKADLNWTDRTSRSSTEMRNSNCRPPLKNPVPEIGGYKAVFVGFPVWWYREPSIIDTFMETCFFEGQTVVPFATSGGSGMGETSERLQKLAPQAVVKPGRRFEANVTKQELADWAQSAL